MEKWVRVYCGGEIVADSRRPRLLRAHGQIPVYYFPETDVRMERLKPAGDDVEVAEQGEGPWPEPPPGSRIFDVKNRRGETKRAAWQVGEASDGHTDLEGHLAFAWKAMDAWFEEDWPIRVHPHDPYHLIDVRPSSRHLRVEIRGETVAETRRPVLLFETGLPTRFYFPRMDVRMELFRPGTLTTHCGYKGSAIHESLEVGGQRFENLAWCYPFPNPGYEQIQNLVAFYQNRIEDFFVDGERLGA